MKLSVERAGSTTCPMIISQTAVYALRAVVVLALSPEGVLVPAKELAHRTGVPQHYLGKVMRQLVVAGLVRGSRGHGGGFALDRPPADVHFADVLAAVGAGARPGVCAFDWQSCDPRHPCPLHPAWSQMQEALDRWAHTTTLRSLLDAGDRERTNA